MIEHRINRTTSHPTPPRAQHPAPRPRAGARNPGFAGTHAVAKAVAAVEAVIGELAQPNVRAWAAEIEANAGPHGGLLPLHGPDAPPDGAPAPG